MNLRVFAITAHSDRSETRLLLELAGRGAELHVVHDPESRTATAFREAGIAVTGLRLRSRLDIAAVRVLRKKLLASRFDIIHAFTNRALANGILASRGLGIKRVAYRGTIGHVSRFDPASWLTYLNPGVDRIICVSDAVKDYLLSIGIPSARLARIYKGHDVAWYGRSPPADLARFGIPPDAFVVGFAGNMRRVKGCDVLIRAAHLVPGSLRAHFLLVGEARDRNVLKLAADDRVRDTVHLTGFMPDAPSLIGACDVFVMPSIAREGLPRAVIEAMAQEVPPIVTNVGGMPELVVNGECGLVVEPGNPRVLADAICSMAERPGIREAMGKRARRRIETDFNIEQTISQTVSLYESLLFLDSSALARRSREAE